MIEKLEANPMSGALGWLLEMELVQNPTVLNSIILNIFKTVRSLKDAEFVVDTKEKKILVYLELSRWDMWFHKNEISDKVMELLDQALPTFKKRIIHDKSILEKAIKIVNSRPS
jgi:hypothetical protein